MKVDSERLYGWLFRAFVLLFVVSESIFIFFDTRYPHGDPYAPLVIEFINLSPIIGVVDALWHMVAQNLSRPPLYLMLQSLFYFPLGEGIDAMYRLNLLLHIATGIIVYFAGKKIGGGMTGIIGSILVIGAPALINLNRTIMSKSISPLGVAIFIYALISFVERQTLRRALLLGGSMGFALLVHPKLSVVVVPAVVAVLSYLYLYRKFFDQQEAPNFFRNTGVIGVTAAFIGIPWYIIFWDRFASTLGEVKEIWSKQTVGFFEYPPGPLWYFKTAPSVLSWPFVVALVISLCMLLVVRSRYTNVLVIGTLAAVVGYLTTPGISAWHDAAPFIVFFSLIIAAACGRVTEKSLIFSVPHFWVVVWGGWSLLLISAITWGFPSLNGVLGKVVGTNSKYCNSYRLIFDICNDKPWIHNEPWDRILKAMDENADCRSKSCSVLTLNYSEDALTFYSRLNYPWMNIRKVPSIYYESAVNRTEYILVNKSDPKAYELMKTHRLVREAPADDWGYRIFLLRRIDGTDKPVRFAQGQCLNNEETITPQIKFYVEPSKKYTMSTGRFESKYISRPYTKDNNIFLTITSDKTEELEISGLPSAGYSLCDYTDRGGSCDEFAQRIFADPNACGEPCASIECITLNATTGKTNAQKIHRSLTKVR